MRENDWIIANMNNPTFDVGDFLYISGMTLGNTLLLPKDQYLKSDYIRQNNQFKDSLGNFKEELFNQFYQQVSKTFADFSTENTIDDYEYSMWDVMRPKDGKVKDVNFKLDSTYNPTHMSIGVVGFNEISESNKSQRELALDSKIYDPSTGKFLDYSVNDISFWNNPIGYFKSLFDEPLVYATYDEDTEEIDPYTGNKVLHKKGEWKVNAEGEFYTERLNGRSLIGKLVVSATDYLTPENSIINKYDFFDSDDILKSVGGTILKNVAAVLPLFIPYVNVAYSGLLVGREITKSLPMLYGMAKGLTGSDEVDSKFLNTMAAYGQMFSSGTSDYAQQNTFSFENFGNLMSDVALQWGQLKFIANTFSKLTGGGKRAMDTAFAKAQQKYLLETENSIYKVFSGEMSEAKFVQMTGITSPLKVKDEIGELLKSGAWAKTFYGSGAIKLFIPAALKAVERRMRTGLDLSLVYMAIVSNTDVYESVLEHGGTPFEAAAIALGSTVGMFSVDKYLGLGEMFFNQEPARKAIRDCAVHNAEILMKSAGIKAAETSSKKGIMGLIKRGIDSGRKAVDDYYSAIKDRSLGFIGKSLGEGLEEVSEELVADMSKTMGELAGRLGYFSQNDYGAWDNAFDRYTMSFLGGAAGGGLFYGVEAVQNRNNKSTLDFLNDVIYLLREGKKDEILKELETLRRRGKLGSKDLAYNKTTTDSDGNIVQLTADNESESESDFVYNRLKNIINQLDLILNENLLNLNDDELFDKMVLGEYRAAVLSDFLKGNKENSKEVSYITRYQQDFQELANKIVNKEAEIQDKLNSTPDPAKRNDVFKEELEKLKAEKLELLELRDYLFGEGSLGYVEKMLFAIDTNLSGKFITLSYDLFVRHKTGKAVSELTEAEQETFSKLYKDYSKTTKMTLDAAFKLFKEMLKKLNPEIQNLANIDLSKAIELARKIAEADPFYKRADYDFRLEEESDEDYNDRRTKRENETDEQFRARTEDRIAKINKYNEDNTFKWVNELALMPIDRGTFRTLLPKLNILKKTIRDKIIEGFTMGGMADAQQKIWKIIKNIGIEKGKRSELYKLIYQTIKLSVRALELLKYEDLLGLDEQWDVVKAKLKKIALLSEELKLLLGLPSNYEYDEESPLTKADVYTIIKNKVEEERSKGVDMSADEIADWLEEDLLFFFDDTKAGKLNKGLIDFFLRVESGITLLSSDEASEQVEFSENSFNRMVNAKATDLLHLAKEALD